MKKKDWERKDRVKEEGKQAYRDGLSLDDNPYKRSEWGMGWDWEKGFREEKQKHEPYEGPSPAEKYDEMLKKRGV